VVCDRVVERARPRHGEAVVVQDRRCFGHRSGR
jgi:hypothetical protein